MARPISDTQHLVADIITEHMTAYPSTSRKDMLAIIVKEANVTQSAAGYYIDRACRHIFQALHKKAVD